MTHEAKKWLPEPKITQILQIVESWAVTLATSTSGVANFQSSSVLTWIGNDLFNHAALANSPNIISPNKVWYQNETFCSVAMLQKVCTHSYSCSFHNRKFSGKSLFGPLCTTRYLCTFLGLIADSGDWMLKQQCWVPAHTLPTPLRTKFTGINDQI